MSPLPVFPVSQGELSTKGDVGSSGWLKGSKGSFQGNAQRKPNPPSQHRRLKMKMVKSLLLGSAAGLVAVAGAQAADLPVKAKPVQYVKICTLYGAGY